MRLDVDVFSDPVPIRFDDAGFSVRVRRPTARDLAAALDVCLSGSLERMTDAALGLIVGFDGITGPDGRPVPDEVRDGDGRTVRAAPRILAALGPRIQFDVVAGVLAFCGVPAEVTAAAGVAVSAVIGQPAAMDADDAGDRDQVPGRGLQPAREQATASRDQGTGIREQA